MKWPTPGDPVQQAAQHDRERQTPQQGSVVRPLANPSHGDDSDTNGWDQFGTQNRCEAQHCRAQEDVSFGGPPVMTAPGKPAILRPQRKPQTTGASDRMHIKTATPPRPASGGDPNSCPTAMNPAINPGHSQLRSPT